MKLSVCLVVKNEEETIEGCLAGVVGVADEVLVMDTGSTDRTVEILRDCFGITPFMGTVRAGDPHGLMPMRNFLADQARNPWVLKLDADERISRAEAAALLQMPDDPDLAGYFVAWETHLPGEVIQDYKLAIHRREVRQQGWIHENGQIELRMRGLNAVWLDSVRLMHFPPPSRAARKFSHYRECLEAAIGADPQCYRCHWFLGYQLFRDGQSDAALPYLRHAAESESRLFPVECLNSKMVLAEVHARRGERDAAGRVLRSAQAFYHAVADDFEVRVNFRMRPWIEQSLESCERGELESIRAYRFAY